MTNCSELFKKKKISFVVAISTFYTLYFWNISASRLALIPTPFPGHSTSAERGRLQGERTQVIQSPPHPPTHTHIVCQPFVIMLYYFCFPALCH